MSPSTKGILCTVYRVVNLPMDFISADHSAEVRSSTAGSLIKVFVQSFDMLRLDDVRPVQMRGGLEDDARPHIGNGSLLQMRWPASA